jgi:hypothetical protein
LKLSRFVSPLVLFSMLFFSNLAVHAEDSAATPEDFKASVLALDAPVAASAATSATPLVVSTVTVGYQTTGVPCVNCVTGGGSGATGIPLPIGVMNQGGGVTFTIPVHDVSFTGNMTVALLVKQGSTIIAGGKTTINNVVPNTVYVVSFNGTVPSKPGAVTVIGAAQPGTGTFVGQGVGLFIQ